MSISNTVTYGSTNTGQVTFPYVTMSVNTQVLYADDNMSQVGTRYDFIINGFITSSSQSDFNTQVKTMRDVLTRPRQPFHVDWDDGTGPYVLYSFAAQNEDIDWGPKPGELELTRFSGGRAAMYRWTLTVVTKENVSTTTPSPNEANGILAMTWEFTHAIDANGYTTRTTSGTILLESGQVQNDLGADYDRTVVTNAIPVPKWFKRTSMDFHQNPNGRVLSFTLVDVEQYLTLPTPITRGHADWSIRTPGILSGQDLIATATLSGYFETSAAHSKTELLNAIYNLATVKFAGLPADSSCIPGDREIRESVYSNRIEFTISASFAIGTLANGQVDYNAGLQTVGVAPPGSDGTAIGINAYGQTDNLNSGVVAATPQPFDALSSPQLTNAANLATIKKENTQNSVARWGNAGSNPTPPLSSIKFDKTGITAIHAKNPFIEFHEVISYELDNKIKVFYPKLPGKPPVFQQTANPSLKIIQAGYFKQAALAPQGSQPPAISAPNPPSPVGNTILSFYVSPAVPEPIADGSWNLYTIQWRYVLEATFVPQDPMLTTNKLSFPYDPRRPSITGQGYQGPSVPTLPEVAIIPKD